MSAWRDAALDKYDRLGMTVFPYDADGDPFEGWPNPSAMAGHRDLVPKVRTFGVLLGGPYVVVDIDANRGGDLTALEAAYGPLPPTMTVVTPGGERNLHLYFRVSGDELRTCKRLSFPGIDFLGAGANVKGATSRRMVGKYLSLTYKEQRPYLDPAPLPPALEQAWRQKAPNNDRDEYRVALDQRADVTLSEAERLFVVDQVRDSLSAIRSGRDGARHDVLFRKARDVYQCAVLLGKDPRDYDGAIRQAYHDSGGRDAAELEKQLRSTKLYALDHPRPRPVVSARTTVAHPSIGTWGDLAISDTRVQDVKLRALIEAVAEEATVERDGEYRDVTMSTAGTLLVQKYPKVGSQKEVSRNLGVLRRRGLIEHVDDKRVALTGWNVPKYQLRR